MPVAEVTGLGSADGYYLAKDRMQGLLDILGQQGYRVIGPVVRDEAIVFKPLTRVDELARGISDQQSPGRYRLKRGATQWFSWANGAAALKPLVFPPHEDLWRCDRDADDVAAMPAFAVVEPPPEKLAAIAARACDLAALAILDRHFTEGVSDHHYHTRRRRLLLIAVNCSHPADTCFCHATGDGPVAEEGADLVMTELADGFVVQGLSVAGSDIIALLHLSAADEGQRQSAAQVCSQAAATLAARRPAVEVRERFPDAPDSPVWQEVAERCLACGNCTAVCPTCFCYREVARVEDDLAGSVQAREWESCFSESHSYIHGIVIRSDPAHRYRQWLSHKFSTWHDQMGRSGCVGCGRCITWCPAGINILDELAQVAARGGDS